MSAAQNELLVCFLFSIYAIIWRFIPVISFFSTELWGLLLRRSTRTTRYVKLYDLHCPIKIMFFHIHCTTYTIICLRIFLLQINPHVFTVRLGVMGTYPPLPRFYELNIKLYTWEIGDFALSYHFACDKVDWLKNMYEVRDFW